MHESKIKELQKEEASEENLEERTKLGEEILEIVSYFSVNSARIYLLKSRGS